MVDRMDGRGVWVYWWKNRERPSEGVGTFGDKEPAKFV